VGHLLQKRKSDTLWDKLLKQTLSPETALTAVERLVKGLRYFSQ
jgi:hypothetical protein